MAPEQSCGERRRRWKSISTPSARARKESRRVERCRVDDVDMHCFLNEGCEAAEARKQRGVQVE